MLQMASVYGLQQTAKHAPAFFFPRAAEVKGCCSCLRLLLRHGVWGGVKSEGQHRTRSGVRSR